VAGPRIIVLTAIKMEARAVTRSVGDAAEVHAIGVGAIRVPDLAGARLVVMAGLAGGLDPVLHVGEVVVDECSAVDGLPYRRVKFACSAAVVGSVEAKAELWRRTGAAVVEMEGERVRSLCQAAGVPYVGVRAISDAAGDAVDPAVLRFVDPFGSVRVGALMVGLMRRPASVRELRKLSRASGVALGALAEAVKLVCGKR
jgi:uridine phosphorylase